MKKFADRIEDDFLASGIMSQVTVNGIPSLEISVEISENTLRQYGLSINEIANIIRLNNRDVSGGSIKTSEEELLIRSRYKANQAENVEKIVLRTNPNGSFITIGDVANVKERFAETPNQTFYNGENSVGVRVMKLPEEDLLEITDYVYNYIENFNEANSQIQLDITFDTSTMLKERLGLLTTNGAMGLFLVVIVLGIFLNFRLSFWVAIGIPISFLGMLAMGNALEITINQMSLFGMILVIGILVDDGIVISENIFDHMQRGKSTFRATVDGTMEVFPAVFTSVMTTIVVFCTFFFLEGMLGEFVIEMGIVVIACLGFSLVEAAFVLPSHLNNPKINSEPNKLRKKFEQGLDKVRYHYYGKYIDFTLKWRWVFCSILLFFIFTMFGLLSGGYIKTAFFPFIDSNDIEAQIVLKPGTNENITEQLLRNINVKVWEANKEISKERKDQKDVILSTEINVGANDLASGGHAGNIKIRLLDGEVRNMESFKIANIIKEKIGSIPEAESFVVGGRRSFGKPVSIRFLSNNVEQLSAIKEDFKATLSEFSALKDITDNDEIGKREIEIRLKEKAYLLGLNNNDITSQIRQNIYGQEAQRLQVGSDEVRVWVRYPKDDRVNINQLEDLTIRTADNNLIPLRELADFSITRGIVKINHYNGFRESLIEAEQTDPNEALGPITEEINEKILPDLLQKYPDVKIAFSGQAKDNEKLFGSIMKVVPIVLLIVFLLIALTFRSFLQTIVVLFLIIPGICGSFLGHSIEGINIVIMSHLGSVALGGVIINDAVVFIDKFNSNIREGMSVYVAAHKAGTSRFRAIILTSITTVAGLYPLIFEQSLQAQFLIPMAVTVAYGVLIGTLIILGFLPALLLTLNDFRYIISWFWTGKKPTREEVEPAYKEIKRLDEIDKNEV